INLPTLAERLEDLPLLVEHFLKLFNPELGKNIQSASPEVMKLLEAHSWAGNIRELQIVIKYAMIHAVGETLTPDSLPDNILKNPPDGQPVVSASPAAETLDIVQMVRDLLRAGEADIYRKVCLAVDRAVLEEVLRYTRGNQVHASDLLRISRTTLRAKLRS